MNNNHFSVLIAEPDQAFRQKLKNILSNIAATAPATRFSISEPEMPEEIERTYKTRNPDMVFLDSEYLLEKSGRIMQMFRGKKTKRQLVMLISDDGSARIKEVLQGLEKEKALYLNGHILKDNFSRELITVLIRFFIRKAEK